jgi:hypothetical protein
MIRLKEKKLKWKRYQTGQWVLQKKKKTLFIEL